MHLNNEFIKNMTNLYGVEGEKWLANLPDRITKLQEHWNLSHLTPVENMSFHYVAKAIANSSQPVVLKMGYDTKSIQNEALALRRFNGDGAIRLIDCRTELNALLLEQAVSGVTLKSIKQTDFHNILDFYIQTIQKLHTKSSIHSHPTLSDWLLALDQASAGNFPAGMLNKAILIKNQLLETTSNPVFLHGDLHLDNILLNGSEWIAIDPKGVIGEREFEIFALDFMHHTDLENNSNINPLLVSQSELIAAKSGLDAMRIQQWAFVRLVLAAAWSIEDNCDPSWAINLAKKIP